MPILKTQEQLTLEDLQKRVEKLEQQNNPSKEVTPEAKFKVGEFSEAYLKGLLNQTEQPKPQTKYRKNGALVFAPIRGWKYYSIDLDNTSKTDIYNWEENPIDLLWLQQGLVFDNQQACQLWADKLKMAYALKQRIVEAESKNEDLEYCYISFYLPENKKEYSFEQIFPMITPSVLTVSTNAKDILMSDEVSDEEFKAFIEVFSL